MRARVMARLPAFALALFAATSVQAGASTCRLLEGELDFGVIDTDARQLHDAVGYLRITCSGDGTAPIFVRIAMDAHPSSEVAVAIFADPAHQFRWDSNGQSLDFQVQPDGKPLLIPLFGVVSAKQHARAGREQVAVRVSIEQIQGSSAQEAGP